MSTITDVKGLQKAWTGLYLFDVVDLAGNPYYWSTQALTWSGHPGGSQTYSALILEHSALKIDIGVYGVEAVPEISFTLNNADGNLTSLVAPSNWDGAEITIYFIFLDPATGAITTDNICFGKFIADLPSDVWPRIQVAAQNKLNLARKTLPLSYLTQYDRYPFPSTLAERQAGCLDCGGDASSPFYALGYCPTHSHGNWKSTSPDVAYIADDYNGTRDVDGTDGTVCLATIGLSARFGGCASYCPPTVSYNPKKGETAQFVGSSNQAKVGQPIPLVYGTCRIQPVVLDTGGPSGWNGARLSHLLLCDGVNFAPDVDDYGISSVTEVILPGVKDGKDYRMPSTSSQTNVTGSWSYVLGKLGNQQISPYPDPAYRNIDSGDYLAGGDFNGRDLYSGLAVLSVGYPKELAAQDSETGPRTEAIVQGLKIETWDDDSPPVSTWMWSDNPVWIYIDLLKRLGWSTADIDKTAAYNAAAYCDEVLANGKKRFRCNLALTAKTPAQTLLRGIRNNCRLYNTYSSAGKLYLKIEKTFAGEGGSAFAIDETNIVRENGQLCIKKWHKSRYETANCYSLNCQDEDNDYIADSESRSDVDQINRVGQIDGDTTTSILGIPSRDQAIRILDWVKYEAVDANEWYTVRVNRSFIQAQVGQVGTIMEARHGLSSQQCRLRSWAPGPGGTIDLILQKHGDAGYVDDAVTQPLVRALSDSTYSPRSVANLALAELFIQDDQNYDVYRRKIQATFSVPPTAYDSSFTAWIQLSAVVHTTGGTIADDQIFFAEVAPKLSGIEGIPSREVLIQIPAGGANTNSVDLTITLPAEADSYVIRIGVIPGKLYKHSAAAHSGTTPFIVTVTSIASLDQTSLSVDPRFDHVHFFYRYGSGELRDGGRTGVATDVTYLFEPEAPQATDTDITVYAVSANAKETDFFPLGGAPYAILALTKDTGNPSGASGLTILTNADDSTIPPGQFVAQFNRDTTNYRSIYAIAVVVSSSSPAEGPYKTERDSHADEIIETGTCTIVAGQKAVTVTRAADPDVISRVLCIYTNDASPDSDLDGNFVEGQALNSLTLAMPFNKSGAFSYAIIKRWFDTTDSTNVLYLQFTPKDIGGIDAPVWRTPPAAYPVGTFYVTVYSRGTFGLGTRQIASSKVMSGAPAGWVELIDADPIEVDAALGDRFYCVLDKMGATRELANFTNQTPGQNVDILFKQPGSPGFEVALEMSDGWLPSSSSAYSSFLETQIAIDPTDYDEVDGWYFEIVARNGNGSNAYNVYLKKSGGSVIATINIPANTPSGATDKQRFRSQDLTIAAGIYLMEIDQTGGSQDVVVSAARIIVAQRGDATKTRLQIPLIGQDAVAGGTNGYFEIDYIAGSTYSQGSPERCALYRKTESDFATIDTWAFEAVIRRWISGTSYISLFNATDANQISASELSTTNNTPTLVSTDLANDATNFEDDDDIEIRHKGSGGSYVYRACLYVALTSLSAGKVFKRVLKHSSTIDVGALIVWQDRLVNYGGQYFEATGYKTDGDQAHGAYVRDDGTNDNGISGGTDNTDSKLEFGTNKERQRSGLISTAAGDRFIADLVIDSGDGTFHVCNACLLESLPRDYIPADLTFDTDFRFRAALPAGDFEDLSDAADAVDLLHFKCNELDGKIEGVAIEKDYGA